MATSKAKEIKKQETLVRFSIISYKTRLRVRAPSTLDFKGLDMRNLQYGPRSCQKSCSKVTKTI